MRVLIIPEDFRNDEHILKPIFSRLFDAIGLASARVNVCRDPRLGGVDQATDLTRLREVVSRYRMVDVFILCIGRDGKIGRRQSLDRIEEELGSDFLAVNVWEELETWVLSAIRLPSTWRWADVRAEVDVKENYFEPLVAQMALSASPGGGRKILAERASRRIRTIRQKCPEDFDDIALRLESRN